MGLGLIASLIPQLSFTIHGEKVAASMPFKSDIGKKGSPLRGPQQKIKKRIFSKIVTIIFFSFADHHGIIFPTGKRPISRINFLSRREEK